MNLALPRPSYPSLNRCRYSLLFALHSGCMRRSARSNLPIAQSLSSYSSPRALGARRHRLLLGQRECLHLSERRDGARTKLSPEAALLEATKRRERWFRVRVHPDRSSEQLGRERACGIDVATPD